MAMMAVVMARDRHLDSRHTLPGRAGRVNAGLSHNLARVIDHPIGTPGSWLACERTCSWDRRDHLRRRAR
jgi:hypothetical protein